MLAYNRANRQVYLFYFHCSAILCNHQRTVSKGHDGQITRIEDKLKALKYQRKCLKEEIIKIDPKKKKTVPQLTEDESDLDEEWISQYLILTKEKDEQKNQQKLEKLNEKRKQESLSPVKHLPPTTKKEPSIDKLEKQLATVSDRIKATKSSLIDKDENKTTALSTSKINYIDPRISVAWCLKYDVPIEKVFNKTLREKFKWAMDLKKGWVNFTHYSCLGILMRELMYQVNFFTW